MSAPEETPAVVEVKAEPAPEPAPEPAMSMPAIFHVVSYLDNESVDYKSFSSLLELVNHLKGLAGRNREDMNVLVFRGELLEFTESFPKNHPYLIVPGDGPIPLFNIPAPGPATKSRRLCMPKMEAEMDYSSLTAQFDKEIHERLAEVPKKDALPDDDDEKLGPEN